MPNAKRNRTSEHLVVIGSSAGGIEALVALVANLPRDFNAPIVVAQHLDPTRASQLAELIGHRTPLQVQTVGGDGGTLQPGIIYVVPPDRNVSISGQTVRLDNGQAGKHPKPSADQLFNTAAYAFGDRTIGVILSGTGSDGAAGARAIKKAGGTIIIQDPATAAYPGMPLSLAPTTVDIIAAPERIGPILDDLLGGIPVPGRPDEKHLLDAFLTDVRDRSGIDFASYKTPTILRRLQRRIAATDTQDLRGYIAYLRNHPEEYQQLVNTFLIKVTEFFRDPDLFAYVRDTILPNLIATARRRGDALRIWSAGCATGEEAYSLAILVAEALGDTLDQLQVRIFATDADADAVAFARRGLYPASALVGVPEDIIARYFIREDGNYQIKKRIRALTVFGQHDLGGRAPFPNIDLVVCRNVLIYFTSDLQQRTLKLFAYSLRNGGYLVLGKAETPAPLAEFFTPQHAQFKVYRREGDRVLMPPARTTGPLPAPPQRLTLARRPPVGIEPLRGWQRDIQRVRTGAERLLQSLSIGVVVVDRRYDIQSINSAARRLLSIHGPALGEDVIHQAQEIPPIALREAIDAAMRTMQPSVLEEIEVEPIAANETLFLKITCSPQREEGDSGPVEHVTLVIEDVSQQVMARRSTEQRLQAATGQLETLRHGAEAGVQARETQVQRLAETNRQLIEANQELTSVNEELRATNEELLLSAEEAQAAIEEVETLNEELQATNEELETLNEELQSTIEELNTTNDDLQARSVELQMLARTSEEERAQLQTILAGMADAVLVVTRTGAPILTNAAYERLFGSGGPAATPRDEQGHILTPRQTPQQRAARGESFTMEFTTVDEEGTRRWFEATGQPVSDAEGRHQCGVVVIRDITERSIHRLQDEFIALASHELRAPLTPLQTYLQLLARRVEQEPPDQPEQRYIQGALAQTRRLARLVHDLLDARRLQSGKFSIQRARVTLNPLVAQTVQDAQALTQKQTIRLSSTEEPLVMMGDAERLQQVLFNLLVNAITHAPDSAAIDVRLSRTGNSAELQVRDYGPGIPQTERDQIFSRYYQAPGNTHGGKGLGLGLYIAKEIIVAHGGGIEVRSAPGAGATFSISLPLAADTADTGA